MKHKLTFSQQELDDLERGLYEGIERLFENASDYKAGSVRRERATKQITRLLMLRGKLLPYVSERAQKRIYKYK